MRGTISKVDRKSGHKWRARVDIPSASGERERKTKVFDTKKEAEKWLAEINAELDKYGRLTNSDVPLKEFLEEWYQQHAKPNLKATTHERYYRLIENHINPEIGDVPLENISPMMLNKFYRDREENGRINGEGGLSSNTVKQIHSILHKAFEDAIRWQRMKTNPASSVEAPSTSERQIETLSPQQSQTFLDAAEELSAYGPIYHMALVLGMRRGEILGLRWEDVDLDEGTITINQSYTMTGAGNHVFTTPKNDSSRRTLGLTKDLIRKLNNHRQEQNKLRMKVGPEWENAEDLVFTAQNGAPLDTSNVQRNFKNILESVDLPEIRFHDLRHTCATLLLENGEHPKTVSHKLGHSSIQVTLDTYSHVSIDLQQAASQSLEDSILNQGKSTETGDF